MFKLYIVPVQIAHQNSGRVWFSASSLRGAKSLVSKPVGSLPSGPYHPLHQGL